MKLLHKISPHYFIFYLLFLFLVIVFSIVGIVLAVAPNPGHNFTEVSGGIATGQLIYGSAADTFSALSDVAVGSYLRSGGVSTAPLWSTPTLPNTASNLKIMIGNATNWVESTPAYPNASVTAGKVIISDGTNYIASTPTYPNASPGAGTFPRGDATNFVTSTLTIPNTSTTGDVFVSTGTNVVGVVAVQATANKVLMSGASVVPTWSTPTFPNASATSGKIIVSDGTNYIASTPTFPNASATSRKKIVSDGTNWVASTETWAVPGTSGNVLTSDGTNWLSSAPNTRSVFNQSVTTPAAGFASDTYLVGSSTDIPATGLKAGSRYHMIFQASKTNAGTATPILNVRFGTAGSTADTSRCALTFTAQTAATDTGTFEIWATFRTVGSGTAAVLQCAGQRRHGASVTGFGNLVSETQVATSGGFDSTVANSIVGTSVNGGTSAAWTITLVQAELTNLP